ncbi:hypothetical protein KVR01_000790 [Diaporthe batatas]|uniref:uncharacterized protein n=1 Tax=Diaporthe batatas TaxID=748121 RepID=UPI001D04EAB9|nr:uncharacterized protein KVR01_000790 [Diaporthe batatas]KAG8170045.1 hypothetical protein KVR01_000790 [Diaporthe batatas]
MIPIPRKQTVPEIETPENVTRQPYHMNPSRNIAAEVRRRLDSELQDGTHPTTEALVPLGMRFLRILGAGTQGTAVLFEMDEADGTTKKVVAKYDTSGEDDDEDGLLEEKELMRAMVGARHIIQRQFIHGYDVAVDEENYYDDPNMYLMEFM